MLKTNTHIQLTAAVLITFDLREWHILTVTDFLFSFTSLQ